MKRGSESNGKAPKPEIICNRDGKTLTLTIKIPSQLDIIVENVDEGQTDGGQTDVSAQAPRRKSSKGNGGSPTRKRSSATPTKGRLSRTPSVGRRASRSGSSPTNGKKKRHSAALEEILLANPAFLNSIAQAVELETRGAELGEAESENWPLPFSGSSRDIAASSMYICLPFSKSKTDRNSDANGVKCPVGCMPIPPPTRGPSSLEPSPGFNAVPENAAVVQNSVNGALANSAINQHVPNHVTSEQHSPQTSQQIASEKPVHPNAPIPGKESPIHNPGEIAAENHADTRKHSANAPPAPEQIRKPSQDLKTQSVPSPAQNVQPPVQSAPPTANHSPASDAPGQNLQPPVQPASPRKLSPASDAPAQNLEPLVQPASPRKLSPASVDPAQNLQPPEQPASPRKLSPASVDPVQNLQSPEQPASPRKLSPASDAPAQNLQPPAQFASPPAKKSSPGENLEMIPAEHREALLEKQKSAQASNNGKATSVSIVTNISTVVTKSDHAIEKVHRIESEIRISVQNDQAEDSERCESGEIAQDSSGSPCVIGSEDDDQCRCPEDLQSQCCPGPEANASVPAPEALNECNCPPPCTCEGSSQGKCSCADPSSCTPQELESLCTAAGRQNSGAGIPQESYVDPNGRLNEEGHLDPTSEESDAGRSATEESDVEPTTEESYSAPIPENGAESDPENYVEPTAGNYAEPVVGNYGDESDTEPSQEISVDDCASHCGFDVDELEPDEGVCTCAPYCSCDDLATFDPEGTFVPKGTYEYPDECTEDCDGTGGFASVEESVIDIVIESQCEKVVMVDQGTGTDPWQACPPTAHGSGSKSRRSDDFSQTEAASDYKEPPPRPKLVKSASESCLDREQMTYCPPAPPDCRHHRPVPQRPQATCIAPQQHHLNCQENRAQYIMARLQPHRHNYYCLPPPPIPPNPTKCWKYCK